MTIRVTTAGDTTGVTHRWYPASLAHGAFGILAFGYNAGDASADIHFHQPAEIDEVVAELTALRAEMTGLPCPSVAEHSGLPCTETGEHAGHRNGQIVWGPGITAPDPDAGDAIAERAALAASIASGVPLTVYDDEARCECGHLLGSHDVARDSRCLAVGCGCDGFSDAARKAS